MMFTSRKETTFDVVLQEWSESEAFKETHPKYRDTYSQYPSRELLGPISWLLFTRSGLTNFFVHDLRRTTQATWSIRKARPKDFGKVRSIVCFGNDRTVANVAVNQRKEFELEGFDPSLVKQKPIFVMSSENETPFLLDGYHRCCSFLLQGTHLDEPIDVFVGVCPALQESEHFAGR